MTKPKLTKAQEPEWRAEMWDRIEYLREQAYALERQAWSRRDGGQELTMEAMDMQREADRLETELGRAAVDKAEG